MIATQEFEKVLQIKLCRYPEFIPAATVSSYLVDGLLIDSGPAHTAGELADFLRDRKVLKIWSNLFLNGYSPIGQA